MSPSSPPFQSLFLTLGFFLSNGDRWRGAPGAGPGRLIIDQKDRDGSRGGEDIEERRRSGRNLWNLCFRSRDVGPAALVYWKLSINEVRLFCLDCRSTPNDRLLVFLSQYTQYIEPLGPERPSKTRTFGQYIPVLTAEDPPQTH